MKTNDPKHEKVAVNIGNMNEKIGMHFYINILNLDDVAEFEEKNTGNMKHTIHALDTFFSSIEYYGKKHYKDYFIVEKITGSRLHMYVLHNEMAELFKIVSSIAVYANKLTSYFENNISKYKTLIPFEIQVGVHYGKFYEFEFVHNNYCEVTTIGYVCNYAAKLQALAKPKCIMISKDVYDSLNMEKKGLFIERTPSSIRRYDQKYCYELLINYLPNVNLSEPDFEYAKELAKKINLHDIQFRDAIKPVSYEALSKSECKKINGIPLFADIRGFTSQFNSDDTNLEEMTRKTENILMSMYSVIDKCNGIHVQFQGDREFALFHDYSDYSCIEDAVIAGLRVIDAVKPYGVNVGVGESFGRLFAAKIGARNEKDNVLLGRTVSEANKNEDEYARENQLVISKSIYEYIRIKNPSLAGIFKKMSEQLYFTDLGYKLFIKNQQEQQLLRDNQKRNYNGAWGDCDFD